MEELKSNKVIHGACFQSMDEDEKAGNMVTERYEGPGDWGWWC